MNDRTIPSELTLLVDGVETRYTIDPNFSYYGANCDVFAARSQKDREPVIIKMFRLDQRRERELGIIHRLSDRYGLASGNYFMGDCYETISDGHSYPYCHVFRRINGRPLQKTVALSGERDHHFLVRTLQTFLGFLEGVALFHNLKYAHWDIKPENIYCFQATIRDPLIIQLIDFDTAVDQSAFPTQSAARNLFSMYAKEVAMGSLPKWYFSDEIRQAQKLLSEDNALALAQSLDLAACARILAYMIFVPEKPVSMSLDEINRRLRNASMDLGTKNALQRFFRRALHEDFAKRFAACSEMQAYLEQVLEGLDENRDVTSLYALRIRLGNYESKSGEAQKFFKQLDTDILSEFRDDKRSYESLRDVLADKPSCVLITGEGGIGKTYALRDEYYRRLYAEDENADVALYVELKGMKAVEEITAKLDEIRRDLRATGLRMPYSVFLDAFDESLMDRDKENDKSRGKKEYKGDGKDEFLSYLSKLQKECRVVVTCRHRIESTQSGLGENPVFFSVVSTVGLRDEQIELYLEKKRLYVNVQSQNAPLVQLLKNPLMLWLFADGWDKAREPKDQADFLQVTNEVELIEQYIWNRFDEKDHTPDYTFENYQTGLTLVALCLYDHGGWITDLESSHQKLINNALRNLGPVAILSEGKITCTHQVFADYFFGIAFTEYFEMLYREAEEHTDQKGIPTAKSRAAYVAMLEAAIDDWHYDHDSDDARRFQGIIIAREEPESAGNIYERLEARTRTVFEYIDWLDRAERKAIGIVFALLAVGILWYLLLLIICVCNREYFDAMRTSMSFLQRGLFVFLNTLYWTFLAWFFLTYVTKRTVAFATVSNHLFSIRCHCQLYRDDWEVCVMPPTVSECHDAKLDPRCKKLILGRDHSGKYGNFFSEAMALEEVDCSHNRRYRFEGGCLYYKNRKLMFVANKSGGLVDIHIPKGVMLRETSTYIAHGGGVRFVRLSGTGRFRQGALCDLFYAREYAYFHGIIFDGTPAQWRRMSKSGDPFFPTKKQYEYWKANDIEDSGFRFLHEQVFDASSFDLSPEEAETLKNGIIPEKSWVYFTQGEPNISQTVNDTIIPSKAYMGSTKFVNLSCPVAEVVNRGAFAFSTVRGVKLPACVTVGAGAFYYAGSLAHIECPRAKIIEKEAFSSTDMQSVSLPACTRIEDFAFAASGISEIYIPLAEYLGTGALSFCKFMTVHLPNCAWIDEGALAFNDKLCEVTLSNRLESLGRWAFRGCRNLVEIKFEGTLTEWWAVRKGRFICDHPLLIRCTDGNWTEIPPGR